MKICGGWSTSSEAGMASGRRQQADMRVAMGIHIEPEIRLVRYKSREVGGSVGSAGAMAETAVLEMQSFREMRDRR